jgi:hypothetical protein
VNSQVALFIYTLLVTEGKVGELCSASLSGSIYGKNDLVIPKGSPFIKLNDMDFAWPFLLKPTTNWQRP